MTVREIAERLADGGNADELYAKARGERRRVFGDKVFLYGFVYFSIWCRNNCNFCYYRRDNEIGRYRKSKDEVMEAALGLAATGVNLVDLTMGEDPSYHADDFETAVSVTRELKSLGVPVMTSPGVIGEKVLDRFASAGADMFALYQETHNRELFSKLRAGQDYDKRMECKMKAREKGMLIEEGILAGAGESEEDIAESLMKMGEIGAAQIRVMSFVPQKGSPMEGLKTPDRSRELKTIALMRLLYPKALIPASLDVDGIAGLRSRIEAGANVVTSIIPPGSGLMGVAQSTMDVDEGGRTYREAVGVLAEMGLRAADRDEFKEYIGGLK